ncbi:hypothetical protein ABFX02_10G130500 [Erythranthe guttata]
MAFYDPKVLEVHVLLVDNNMNFLLETSRMIQFNSYTVTSVQEASVASSILSEGNEKFDLVMVDVSSSNNIEGFKLVHEAVDMGYIVILMANDADTTLVKCAIEDGAFLFMEKVNAAEELKYIWQHVLREKARKNKELNGTLLSTAGEQNQRVFLSEGNRNLDNIGTSTMNRNVDNIDRNIGMSTMNNRVVSETNINVINNRPRRRMGATFIEPANNNNENARGNYMLRPKICTEWTAELHEKFMDAVRELGEGRCFPRDILELMNVPGLTRLQVASHLQKCRHGWQPTYEREGRCTKASKSSSTHWTRTKKYGIVPRARTNYNGTSQEQHNNPIIISDNNVVQYSTPRNNETQNNLIIGQVQGTTALRDDTTNNNNETRDNVIVGQVQGTALWDDTNNNILANNNDIIMNNEIISGVEINNNNANNNNGDMIINGDASFDFAAAAVDGLVANCFDLIGFDYEINASVNPNNSEAANDQGDEYWKSWVEDFTNDNNE